MPVDSISFSLINNDFQTIFLPLEMKICGFFAHEFSFLHHLKAYICINLQTIIKKKLSSGQRVIVHRRLYCAGAFCRLFVTRFSTTYISCCSFSYDTFYRDDCSRPHVQCSKVCVSSLIWHVFIAKQLLPQENH